MSRRFGVVFAQSALKKKLNKEGLSTDFEALFDIKGD